MSDEFSSETSRTNGLAIAAIICAFIFPIAGLIFGIIALAQIKKDPSQNGKGLAVASIIISLILILLAIILIILLFLIPFFLASSVALSTTNFELPSRCTLPSGFGCADYMVGANGQEEINLAFTNGMGTGIIVTGVRAVPHSSNPSKGTCVASLVESYKEYTNILPLTNGEQATVKLICPAGSFDRLNTDPEQKYRWELEIDYFVIDSNPDFKKTVLGELYSSVSS